MVPDHNRACGCEACSMWRSRGGESAAEKAERTMPLPHVTKSTDIIGGLPVNTTTTYYSYPMAGKLVPPDPRGCSGVPAVSSNPKDVLGMKKAPLALNPSVALIHMAKAFEFGAYGRDANGVQVRPKGYGIYNWRENAVSAMVYINAAQRHLAEYLDRTDVADDSKVQQLGHVMACCAIVLDAMEQGNLIDDRPLKGRASEVIERLKVTT